MKRYMIAGNWKMNMNVASVNDYLPTFAKASNEHTDQVQCVLGVPFTLILHTVKLARPHGITIAAQNVHNEPSGAFTGEISLPMLQEQGVDAIIIGHSERRQYFSETDASVALKVTAVQQAGMLPIVCIGESQQERESGKTNEIIDRQMAAILAAADDSTNIVIAYEPVWAIGTGLAATPQMAEAVHAHIRDLLAKKYGDTASQIKILYGGSMKPANIVELLSEANIDGGLIGGASLDASAFAGMVKAANNMHKN